MKLLLSGELFHHYLHPPMPSAFRASYVWQGPQKCYDGQKAWKATLLETGGEALGQENRNHLLRPCLEGSTPAFHTTAFQAAMSRLATDSEGFAPGF